jgi:hypothetical protein
MLPIQNELVNCISAYYLKIPIWFKLQFILVPVTIYNYKFNHTRQFSSQRFYIIIREIIIHLV